MEPDLIAIGIEADTAQVREWMVGRNVPLIDEPSGVSWGIYEAPSGAKIAFGRGADGTEYTDAGLASPYAYRAQGYRVSDNLAYFDLMEEQAGIGNRFLAYVDNPSLLTLDKPTQVIISPAALGAEAAVYDSKESYKQAQAEHNAVGLNTRHLKSPWLLALQAGEATGEEASSVAMFAAVVQNAELRTNELTGQKFWYLLVESVVPMAVAIPAEAAEHVNPGSVIAGAFIIVASVSPAAT